jgi:hypothetical protein
MTEREKAWFLQGFQLGFTHEITGIVEPAYTEFIINGQQLGPTLTAATQLEVEREFEKFMAAAGYTRTTKEDKPAN